MSFSAAIWVGVAVGLVVTRRRRVTSVATALVVLAPTVAIVGGAAAAVFALRARLRSRRHTEEAASADVPLLAELVGLGLSAGLTLRQALASARRHVHPDLGSEVDAVLRQASRRGLGQALAAAGGRGRRLYLVAARAIVTGAPLAAAVDSYVRDAVAEQRASRVEAARRLPVKLMLPLALLILPGFVLLTVGPTVMAALERFVLPQ